MATEAVVPVELFRPASVSAVAGSVAGTVGKSSGLRKFCYIKVEVLR